MELQMKCTSLTILLILLSLLILVISIQVLPDDKEKRMREADSFAEQDLNLFHRAWIEQDVMTLASLTRPPQRRVEDCYQAIKAQEPAVGPLTEVLDLLTQEGRFVHARMRLLHVLSAAQEGNRDNIMYYKLNGAKDWIEKRFNITSTGIHYYMVEAWRSLVRAVDHFDKFTGEILSGLQKVKQETGDRKHEDQEAVREVAEHMIEVVNENRKGIVEEPKRASQMLEALIHHWGSQNEDPARHKHLHVR